MATALSAADALRLLAARAARALDVRSPGEFAQGAVPGFFNGPILNDRERHLVGLTYKERGQAEAIRLGHELVGGATREARVAEWARGLSDGPRALVACWRGGLRSRIACEWLTEKGLAVERVEGGYKELRRELLGGLARPPELLVISGPTGAGKSRLLRAISRPRLDLEELAAHRGSAFGGFADRPQPAQASFENAVALDFLRNAADSRPLVTEDESRMIGRLVLPAAVLERLVTAPIVRVEAALEDRVDHIVGEYVREPLRAGEAPSALRERLLRGLAGISRRLGGAVAADVRARLTDAFAGGGEEAHRAWVRELLLRHYDRAYEYGIARLGRPVAFRGNWKECREWLQTSG